LRGQHPRQKSKGCVTYLTRVTGRPLAPAALVRRRHARPLRKAPAALLRVRRVPAQQRRVARHALVSHSRLDFVVRRQVCKTKQKNSKRVREAGWGKGERTSAATLFQLADVFSMACTCASTKPAFAPFIGAFMPRQRKRGRSRGLILGRVLRSTPPEIGTADRSGFLFQQ
jgi:hypothetical protein